jgi:hypothetical protein
MPNVAGRIFMKDTEVTWDGTQFLGNTTRALLTPDTPEQQLRTLDPGYVLADVDSTTWVFGVSGPQVEEGLSEFLFDNAGEEVEIVLTPKRGTGNNTWTFTIIAKPVPIGGDQGAYATFEATFPVVGEPVRGIAV